MLTSQIVKNCINQIADHASICNIVFLALHSAAAYNIIIWMFLIIILFTAEPEAAKEVVLAEKPVIEQVPNPSAYFLSPNTAI